MPQKEVIKLHGHLCDFYLKYHCELNFIKQYWGAAKLCFHSKEHTATICDMEKVVVECLNSVPLSQIQR
jgi:hypothetical protein